MTSPRRLVAGRRAPAGPIRNELDVAQGAEFNSWPVPAGGTGSKLQQLLIASARGKSPNVCVHQIRNEGAEMSNYVLVADAGIARILKAKGAEGPIVLEEILTFVQPSSRLRGRELTSDRTGRVFDRAAKSGPGTPSSERHGTQSDFDPHAAEVERFALRLGRRLDVLRRSGELEQLHIVAEPKFLGLLRSKLSKPTRLLVQAELARDMVHARPADIAKAVGRAKAVDHTH